MSTTDSATLPKPMAVEDAFENENLNFVSLRELVEQGDGNISKDRKKTFKVISDWFQSFIVNPHDDLGRTGPVCPYAFKGMMLDMIRVSYSDVSSMEGVRIENIVKNCFRELESIAGPKKINRFRCLIFALPNCGDTKGLEAMTAAQGRFKYYTLRNAVLVGSFHKLSEAEGVWNKDFRPQKCEVPLLVVRPMVIYDAPFVVRHMLLLPTYLSRFPIAGFRKFMSYLKMGK